MLQLLASDRSSDGGTASNVSSGYRRLMIGPGVDVRIDKVNIYADALLPLAVDTTAPSTPYAISQGSSGQLVASVIWRLQIGYDF